MHKTNNKYVFKYIFATFLFLVFSTCIPSKTSAASLSLSPSTSTVSLGDIVSVKVFVNTESKSINNGEATILFPTDMLDVISIAKSSSIFSLWVEEPSFSNLTGQIFFNGGLPNPGFNGQNGYLITITFKAKKQGTATVVFTDAAIRENDGLGTDIINNKIGSTFSISAPKIHTLIPSSNNILPRKEVVTAIPLTFTPTVRNENGKDILNLSFVNKNLEVEYYSIIIDDELVLRVNKNELINNEYILPVVKEGSHNISVAIYDKVANRAEAKLSYVSSHITVPILTLSSSEISVGSPIIITGKTDYPNKKVEIILEMDGKEIKKYIETVQTDGSFSVSTEKLEVTGLIGVKARTIFSEFVLSNFSQNIYLKVNEIKAVRVTLAIIYPLVGLILIIVILLLIIFLLYLGWHKFFGLKNKINADMILTVNEVHKAMLLLKEELSNQLESLEAIEIDRKLNKKEKVIFDEITSNINDIDKFIEDKLKKII